MSLTAIPKMLNGMPLFQKWEIKSKDAMDEMDMDLTPWLKGFVKSVGKQKAKMLLNETGVFAEKVSDTPNDSTGPKE